MPPRAASGPLASFREIGLSRRQTRSAAARRDRGLRRPAQRAALDIEKFGRSRPGLPGVVPLGADHARLGGEPGLLARPRRAGLLPFGTA
jgi:hypothetical protein